MTDPRGAITSYDFAGRLRRNEFGSGSVGPDKTYKQTLGYDAFDNVNVRSTWRKSSTAIAFTAGYTNNRKSSGGFNSGSDSYDVSGNVVSNIAGTSDYRQWKFDASGRMVDWLEASPYASTIWDEGATLTFDGDGRIAKKFTRNRDRANGNTTWAEDTEYYIYSSVTGQKVVELDENGAKVKTNVYFGSEAIAEYTSASGVVFKTADPVAGSVMQSEASGAVTANDVGRVETEALGAIVPTQEEELQTPAPRYDKGGYLGNPEFGSTWDHAPIKCSMISSILRRPGAHDVQVNDRTEGGWGLYQSLHNQIRTWRFDVYKPYDRGVDRTVNVEGDYVRITSKLDYLGSLHASFLTPMADGVLALISTSQTAAQDEPTPLTGRARQVWQSEAERLARMLSFVGDKGKTRCRKYLEEMGFDVEAIKAKLGEYEPYRGSFFHAC